MRQMLGHKLAHYFILHMSLYYYNLWWYLLCDRALRHAIIPHIRRVLLHRIRIILLHHRRRHEPRRLLRHAVGVSWDSAPSSR